MALVIVGHPNASFSGYERVVGRGLFFSGGFTELVDLTAAQRTQLMATGYTVDGQPATPVPDPFPQYLTAPEVRTLVTTDQAVLDSQRAALVPFWAPGETVDAGAVRMTALGLTIKRNSSGTTRGTYDGTEAALWTVTSGGTPADGAITPAKLSFDPATQAELDALASSTSTALGTKATASSLSTVATSGAYGDLSGKPTIPAVGSYIALLTGLATGTSAGTANAAVIQAALDAAATAGGGTVVVPAGTWTTAPLKLRTNVTLSGLGYWGTVLRLANAANAHFITLFDANTEHVGIVDLMLDCNGANQTSGNGVHLSNVGYTNNRTWPSSGDPNHYMRRVMIRDAKGHGLYTAGTWSQSHFDGVFVYTSGLNGFRIESPDNFFYNCTAAKSGSENFYIASNSNHFFNCKSWLAGAVDATNGMGYVVTGVDRVDMIGCEAQDNRKHGLSLVTTTQANIVGFRSNRNGLGAAGTGGVGDGVYAFNTTNSRIDIVAYDHNNGGYMQRWGYNLDTGNSGNVVTMAIGAHQDNSVPGIGSWGTGSLVTMTWLGKPVAQPAPPMAATAQTGTTYTLALADMGTVVESNNAAAVTLTVPPNSSAAFPVGTLLEVHQLGTGQVTIAPGAGVTLRSRGGVLKSGGQYGVISLRKRATDEWVVAGDLVA